MDSLEDFLPIPESKPRSAAIAFLLSIFTPGLGQIYNGRLLKGAVIFCGSLLLPVIWGQTRLILSFYGLIFILLVQLSFWIWIVSDAVIQAKKQKSYHPRPYNTWYFHLLIAGGMLAISSLFDVSSILGAQSFRISSSAQSPTLLPGDWVMVDLKAYENEAISYGDIVVFHHSEGEYWTFRVVGLPNDKIAIRNGIAEVNGRLNETETLIDTMTITEPGFMRKQIASELLETLPNGHTYRIHKYQEYYDSQYRNSEPQFIPPAHYFLMGDNRDNAEDSRFIGPVRRSDIVGRLVYSYWGESFDRINIDLTSK